MTQRGHLAGEKSGASQGKIKLFFKLAVGQAAISCRLVQRSASSAESELPPTVLAHQLPKRRPSMPTNIGARQRPSDWQGTERSSDAESIATLWLISYM